MISLKHEWRFLFSFQIFTLLSVTFYYKENYGLSIYTGAFALFNILMAYYFLYFPSGYPVIYKDKIVKKNLKKTLFLRVLELGNGF